MTKTFSRQELYDLVWSKPMITLSKEFNLSDNGLRKICIKHDIPIPKSGYWSKLKFGKNPTKVPLPKTSSTDGDSIEINIIEGKIQNITDKNNFLELINPYIIDQANITGLYKKNN